MIILTSDATKRMHTSMYPVFMTYVLVWGICLNISLSIYKFENSFIMHLSEQIIVYRIDINKKQHLPFLLCL